MRRAGRGSLPGEELELIEDFGERVKRARLRLGLTQEDLAKQLNEKLTIIKKIETGEYKPPIELARKLERFLKIRLLVPAEEFLNEPIDRYVARGGFSGVSLGDLLKKGDDASLKNK